MLTPAWFVDGTTPDLLADVFALGIAAATFFGLVWAAVMWATKPLRTRLDEVHVIAEGLQAERERVDDLNDRVAGLENRLASIERRIEDLYHLLLTIIDPRRMRQDHRTPRPDQPDDE